MPKAWRIVPHDAGQVESLQRASGLSAIVAQLLLRRGVCDAQSAQTFLDPKLSCLRDPSDLPGIDAAVARIGAAIRDKRRIVIYGDYDADGITATSILFRCLSLLGADVGYYVPNRLEEGYGLNQQALEKLAADGASLIVTVDCGIASLAEAERARELGLGLIVTDHHTLADRLPVADAIVHPALPSTSYPFAGLCGAGVAFKLAWALCQDACQARRVSPAMREMLLQAVGLAAIGTVADVVPLVDENRILVRHGLISLKQRPVLGIQRLLDRLKLNNKPTLGSEDIAFMIAPRLNAAGRLGQATLGVELLTTINHDRATALAEYIDELNKSRDSLERSVYLAANKQAKQAIDAGYDSALVLAGHGWHAGVIGIVAGRLAEKYHRPVLIVALDEAGVKPGQGSGRSVPGFDLFKALAACRERLLAFGGHAAAAGFKVEEQHLDALRSDFHDYVADQISPAQRVATLKIDAEVPFSALTYQAVRNIEGLAPFGQSNPRPLLCTSDVQLSAPPKPIGSGDRHLALQLVQHGVRIRGVAFGGGEWADKLAETGGRFAFAYRPVINSYRGRNSVEIQITDWREQVADEVATAPPAQENYPL